MKEDIEIHTMLTIREKAMLTGMNNLSDQEILILITGDCSDKKAKAIHKLINNCDDDISNIMGLDTNELIAASGMSKQTALQISAIIELCKRMKYSQKRVIKTITSNIDVIDLFKPIIEDLPYEELWCLYLTGNNTIIDKTRVSYGGINMTVADIRIILKQAIDKLCSSIILVHNHPSGNSTPSKYDKEFTKHLYEGCKILDIKLIDHIIIATNNNTSLKEMGVL